MLMKGAGSKSVYEMAHSVCQIALSALQSGDNGGGWYVIFPAGDTEHRHQEGAGMFTRAVSGFVCGGNRIMFGQCLSIFFEISAPYPIDAAAAADGAG